MRPAFETGVMLKTLTDMLTLGILLHPVPSQLPA